MQISVRAWLTLSVVASQARNSRSFRLFRIKTNCDEWFDNIFEHIDIYDEAENCHFAGNLKGSKYFLFYGANPHP